MIFCSTKISKVEAEEKMTAVINTPELSKACNKMDGSDTQ